MAKKYGEGRIQVGKQEIQVSTLAEARQELNCTEALHTKESTPIAKTDISTDRDGSVDASIESLRQKIEQLGILEHPFFQQCTKEIPDRLLDRERTQSEIYRFRNMMNAIADESERKPEVAKQFLSVFVEGDRSVLKEKTRNQLRSLRELYFDEDTVLKHPLQYLRKRKKLSEFIDFVSSMSPLRVDKQSDVDTFMSPRATGQTSSFGAIDIVVQADNYVYGSLQYMTHHMARNERLQCALDEDEAVKRGEIVIVDAEDMMGRTSTDFLEQYLKNTFDYAQGKHILALYLASVFDDVEEAMRFYEEGANGGRTTVQRWDSTSRLVAYTISEERMEQITHAFQRVFTSTGIEPPFGVEVRIPHSAINATKQKTR